MANIRNLRSRGVNFSSDLRTAYLPISESPAGTFMLLRRDIETGNEKTLFSRPARGQPDAPPPIGEVSPSPDDRYLAFWEFTDPDTVRMLRVLSTEGGDPRTLLTERWSQEDSPACPGRERPLWTSDGRHLLAILMDSVPGSRPLPPDPCRLYKVPVEGGRPIFVGAIPEANNFSAWALSPDGSRLAYTTGEDRGEIWILQGLEGR
jgi:Tol biopolymer transport system component